METLLEEGFSKSTITILVEAGYDLDLLPHIREQDLETLFPTNLGERQRIRLYLNSKHPTNSLSSTLSSPLSPSPPPSSSPSMPSLPQTPTSSIQTAMSPSALQFSSIVPVCTPPPASRDTSIVQVCTPPPAPEGTSADQDNQWHTEFTIPEERCFGYTVTQAIKTGIVDSKARSRLIRVLRGLILQHTARPTPTQYNTVLKKLIAKYPKLSDGSDGCYQHWKTGLRNSFKNYRRDHAPPVSADRNAPPAKKMKISARTLITEDDYDEAKLLMKEQYKSKRHDRTWCKQLLEETFENRRRWITEDTPDSDTIFKEFPLLLSLSLFRFEFTLVTSLSREEMLTEWDGWMRKIVEVGKVEGSRAPVARLLAALDQVPEEATHHQDYTDFIAVKLLMKLIFNKGMKGILFTHFETKDINIQEEAQEMTQSQPSIFIVGAVGVDAQYHLVLENTVLFEEKTFQDSIIDLFALYYNFQICYPKSLRPLLLFFQCCVYNIDSSDLKKPPAPLAKFIQLANSINN